jgi:CxxC motif-containing protein (DUF1111 family)
MRNVMGCVLAVAATAVIASVPASSEKTGGDTTVFATGRQAFSFPAANLTDAEATRFAIGNSFFKRNWVQASASTTARDGLGPHFIARSCGGCHVQDGRGSPPEISNRIGGQHASPVHLLMRLSIPGTPAKEHGAVSDPVYGDQLNNAAVEGVKPEGDFSIRTTPIPGRFADGTPYTLRKPIYTVHSLAYGPLHSQVMMSPRIAPQVIGMGLIEAIPEAEILRNAREQAAQPGPIKGQPNRVWDAVAQREMTGRFGWKANAASVAHQTASAFNGDIGITSSFFPQEGCTRTQTDCMASPRGAQGKAPEIDDKTLEDVVFYQSTVAPPARRNVHDRQVIRGEKVFAQAQCATCHRPSYTTGTVPAPFARFTSSALFNQTIWPYTDLLLHDMGEALADGRPDFAANGRQWKTPPLWGIGLIKDVNGHQRLLHDGRANGVLEAILWHGGEAQASKEYVLKLTKSERQALVKFVESL